MDSDKVLHFFEELDILTNAFKYYANEKDKDNITIKDMFVNGFMQANQLKEHSKDVRDFKQSLAENKFERLQNFNRIFATAYYRRLLVTFFRESYNYIDFDKLNKNSNWLKVKEEILNNSDASESEKKILLNVETERLIKTICNFLTHENKNKYVLSNKFNYNEQLEYSKQKQITNMEEILFSDFSTEIKFRSYRLKKIFNININNALIGKILNLIATNLNIKIELNMADMLDSDEWIDYISNNGIKYIFKGNEVDYRFDNQELQVIKYLDNYIKTNAPGIDFTETNIKIFEISTCLSIANNTYVRTFYTCKNLRTFNDIAQAMQFLLQLMQVNAKEVKRKDYDGLFIKPVLDKAIMFNFMANVDNMSKDKDGKLTIDVAGIGNIVNHDPKHMHTEMLLTQVLNILEFLDSEQSERQELWQDLGNENVCKQIARSVGQADNLIFIKTIRNSIDHARYIKDDKTIYFYDGEESDVKYKFSLPIKDLETIKIASMKYLKNYLQTYNNQNTQAH